MRILVTGGQGFLGKRLVPILRADGHEVLAPRRGEAGFPLDLALVGEWQGWPTKLDAILHLAALNPDRGEAAARDDAALMRANVAATKALAVEAIRRGARRFVFTSTLLVHPFSPAPIREENPIVPQNAYAASKFAAEEELLATLEDSPVQWTILRLAPIYGPGGRGGLHALLRLAQGSLPLPLGGGGRRSLLSLANAADACRFALEARRMANETCLVADGEALSVGDIVRTVRGIEGRPARVISLPGGPMRHAARLAGKGAAYDRLFGRFESEPAKIQNAGCKPVESRSAGFRAALERSA